MAKKAVFTVVSIILLVVSLALIAYSIWAYTEWKVILDDAIDYGQLDPEDKYTIANYYMGNAGQYAVYGLLMAGTGLLLLKREPEKAAAVPFAALAEIPAPAVTDDDRELDAWLSEMKENAENKQEPEPAAPEEPTEPAENQPAADESAGE